MNKVVCNFFKYLCLQGVATGVLLCGSFYAVAWADSVVMETEGQKPFSSGGQGQSPFSKDADGSIIVQTPAMPQQQGEALPPMNIIVTPEVDWQNTPGRPPYPIIPGNGPSTLPWPPESAIPVRPVPPVVVPPVGVPAENSKGFTVLHPELDPSDPSSPRVPVAVPNGPAIVVPGQN